MKNSQITTDDAGASSRAAHGSANLPTLSAEERGAIEKLSQHDKTQLNHWQSRLKEAQEQVEYWKRQADHSSSLAIRVTMSGWSDSPNQ